MLTPIELNIVAVVDPRKSELTSNFAINIDSQDHYQILGVRPSANSDEIKAAYKLLALQFHPDKNKDPEAASSFVKITAAFDVLGDPEKRLQYDLQKHRPWSAVYSRSRAICFSGVDSQENPELSDILLILLLSSYSASREAVNNSSYFHDENDHSNRSRSSLIIQAIIETLCAFSAFFFQAPIINDLFSNLEPEEGKPDNFVPPAAADDIHRVELERGPSDFANALSELTDEQRAWFKAQSVDSRISSDELDSIFPGFFCEEELRAIDPERSKSSEPRGDFFVSAEDRITRNIKRKLGMCDGPKLIEKLLAAGVKLADVRFFNNSEGILDDGVFGDILVPKSSVTNLSSFQHSLKCVSICNRPFSVTVEGEWLKIDCKQSVNPSYGKIFL